MPCIAPAWRAVLRRPLLANDWPCERTNCGAFWSPDQDNSEAWPSLSRAPCETEWMLLSIGLPRTLQLCLVLFPPLPHSSAMRFPGSALQKNPFDFLSKCLLLMNTDLESIILTPYKNVEYSDLDSCHSENESLTNPSSLLGGTPSSEEDC